MAGAAEEAPPASQTQAVRGMEAGEGDWGLGGAGRVGDGGSGPQPALHGLSAAPGLGRRAHRRAREEVAAVREAEVRGRRAACVFLLLLFLIKEEFISYLPPARGRGAAIGVNGAEEYKKISLRRIIKVTSWNINRRVTCKKCNITIFTRTAERGKAIKFNIKIFHSLDNLVNKHGIGTTFCWS